MEQKYVKPNITENLAERAQKFCGKDKEFRNISHMSDFALRQLIEKLENREK